MADTLPHQVVEFLGKQFAFEEATAESSGSAESDLIVRASPGLVIRWKGLDLASLGTVEDDLEVVGESGGISSIELDGCDYPIIRATLRFRRTGGSVVVEVEGAAETVVYEGCDEVARPVPFKAVFAVPANSG